MGLTTSPHHIFIMWDPLLFLIPLKTRLPHQHTWTKSTITSAKTSSQTTEGVISDFAVEGCNSNKGKR